MQNDFPLYVKIGSSIIQSLVIFIYIFGSAMWLPKLTKVMPFWKVVLLAMAGGIIMSLTISANMYIQLH